MGAKASTEQRPRTFSGSDPSTSSGGGATAVSNNGGASSSTGGGGGGGSGGGGSSSHHHHHHHHHHSFRGGNSNGAGIVTTGGGFSSASGSSSSSALLQGPSTSSVRARSYSSSAVHNSQGAAGIIELGSRINSFASGLWPISVKSRVVDSTPPGSSAFGVDPSCYPQQNGQCNWSVNNSGGSTVVVSNFVPSAPPEPPPSNNNNEGGGGGGTWAIAYANESNGVVQQPYGVKCPICNKSILPDDIEVHLVMCLTRPRLNYNEDFLEESKGDECVICLEELEAGQVIARLPCLCVYHKHCIDEWFQINRSCPEHPNN